jgi:hypothetical protein
MPWPCQVSFDGSLLNHHMHCKLQALIFANANIVHPNFPAACHSANSRTYDVAYSTLFEQEFFDLDRRNLAWQSQITS